MTLTLRLDPGLVAWLIALGCAYLVSPALAGAVVIALLLRR